MPFKSYVTWNNKGGVGKTTLTFHMATQYALSHPNKVVLVIDLCPQANVSLALLHGRENINQLVLQRKTISFYLDQVASSNSLSGVNLQQFLTVVRDFNNQIPPNVQLLCGDKHLEIVSRSLEQKRNANTANDEDWIFFTSCVKYFIEGNDDIPGVATQPDGDRSREWVVFIDTNSSFSVYTEIALLAAQRLIIPVNADDFSREALRDLLHSVYGIAKEPTAFNFYDHTYNFSAKAKKNRLRLPKIYLLIHNRATRYDLRSATAFNLLAKRSMKALKYTFRKSKECFVENTETVEECFVDFYDFHTSGIVALHRGCPLAALTNHFTLSCVPVSVGTVALNAVQIKEQLQCLKDLVLKL